MKFSLNWLSNFVDITEKDQKKLKAIITARTAEIETMEEAGADLENVIVAQIEKILPHPNADKLQIAMVSNGKEQIKVVCGGSNLKEGMKVAYAQLGAIVKWHGTDVVKMEKIKIRGEESSGMICASEEIGLAERFPKKEEKEIVDLSFMNVPVGTPLAEALGMNDIVIDVDNHAITNRPDLFSQKGFARELVANGLAKWKINPTDYKKVEFPNTPLPIDIEITKPELCSRYLAVYLTGIEVKESPDWMRDHLTACGIRPISNIVDITNYVMLELGMPLHAFDLEQVTGKKWTMRSSKKGEKVITLDEKELELFEGITVFDDGNELFDLCGVMGGLHSGINMKTSKVLLHAPVYHPTLVRKAMRGLGQVTDAGIVYEKGVSNHIAEEAIHRAIELILELCPEANLASQLMDVQNYKEEKRIIELSKDYLHKLLGIEIEPTKTIQILTDLGFETKESQKSYEVVVPEWRYEDINIPADLVEEVGRIYGYDQIPSIDPISAIKAVPKNHRRLYEKSLKEQLVQLGLNEIYTFAFLGEELMNKAGIKKNETSIEITNPISSEMSIMRQSLLPRTLETIANNLRYKKDFSLFELSRVYNKESAAPKETSELIMASVEHNFREIQGITEELGLTLRPSRQHEDMHHPGRHADLCLRGQKVGDLYELHPSIQKNFDIKERVVVAEIQIEKIHEMNIKRQVKYAEIPKYPSIQLDISLLIEKKDLAENYLKSIQKADKKLIKNIELIDEYSGEKIEQGKRSLTYSVTYQAEDRTLTDQEVNEVHQKVIENLKKKGAIIRD